MESNTPEGIGSDGDLSIDEAVKAYATNPSNSISDDDEEDGHEADAREAENSENEEDGDQHEEDDASEDEADGDEDDGEPISDDKRKVRLEDGTVITVGELKRGNLREADYTRKRQAHSAEVEAFTSYREQVSQYEQQLNAARDLNIRILESNIPQRPSPDMLATDPLGYIQAERTYNDQVALYNQLQYEAQQSRENQAAISRQENQHRLAQEMHLLHSKAPEFADAQKRDALAREMLPIAIQYGFSETEFGNIDDHRLVLALRDLARLKKSASGIKTVAEKVKDRPPVQTGAKRVPPSAQKAKAADAAMNRLKHSGSVKDGIAAYLATQRG